MRPSRSASGSNSITELANENGNVAPAILPLLSEARIAGVTAGCRTQTTPHRGSITAAMTRAAAESIPTALRIETASTGPHPACTLALFLTMPL